jgi:hypothetical protein
MLKYEDLPDLDQTLALAKVMETFTDEGCTSLYQWGKKRGLSEQQAWSQIVTENGFPDHEMPERLQKQRTQ